MTFFWLSNPTKKFATVEEIGSLALFLASEPERRRSPAQPALPVDGGWVAPTEEEDMERLSKAVRLRPGENSGTPRGRLVRSFSCLRGGGALRGRTRPAFTKRCTQGGVEPD